MNVLRTSSLKQLAAAAALAVGVWAAPVTAHAAGPSDVSAVSGLSVAVTVLGAASMVTEAGGWSVERVQDGANGVEWVLKGVSTGVRTSIRWVGRSAGAVSVGVGTVITVTADAAGSILSVAGKVIGFIPNELGRELLHHTEVQR